MENIIVVFRSLRIISQSRRSERIKLSYVVFNFVHDYILKIVVPLAFSIRPMTR